MAAASKPSAPDHLSETPTRAILVAVQNRDVDEADGRRSLAELEQLLDGLGFVVDATIVQRRSGPSSRSYLGEGKLREVAALTGGSGEIPRGPKAPPVELAEDLVVVADDELGPGQLRNLVAALGVEVLDRTAVILRVFEQRARTKEAKLEIEVARLEYELPRIRDDLTLGDREGGGGRASRGHSNVELSKRRARERIAAAKRELERLSATADLLRKGRADTFSVSLVGYTNAGKSSIMRLLTGSDVFVEDKLFATLDTTVRQLQPPSTPPIVVADTVGFIDRLPHVLVASFRSTLSEARDARLLLHVVDATDPAFRTHMRVTERLLAEIGAKDVPVQVVLNKADGLQAEERSQLAREYPEALLLCALDPEDGVTLRARIEEFFAEQMEERTFAVPYHAQGLLAEFRDRLQVVHEEYGEDLTISVRGTKDVLDRLAARFG